MSLHASLSKQECHISDLTDANLFAIFQNLVPFERLLVSEVCRRWHGLSRKAWLDVTSLDLSSIPGRHINAIVSYCPNLRSVDAKEKSFGQRELYGLHRASHLSRVQFYGCDFATETAEAERLSDFAWILSEQLKNTCLRELVIHNSDSDPDFLYEEDGVGDFRWPKWSFTAANLPASLTRLQLSGLVTDLTFWSRYAADLLEDLALLPNLECLILWAADSNDLMCDCSHGFLKNITGCKNLRELAVCPGFAVKIAEFVSRLPKLEVLFLDVVDWTLESLAELITDARVLRILLLSSEEPPDGCRPERFDSGSVDELPLVFPARKRFPHGFGSDPLPQLHIFVDGSVSPYVRFTQSASDAAVIHAINQPLPEFLEREDIAPIFEGVWLAEKIKETAKQDPTLWLNNVGRTDHSIQYI